MIVFEIKHLKLIYNKIRNLNYRYFLEKLLKNTFYTKESN